MRDADSAENPARAAYWKSEWPRALRWSSLVLFAFLVIASLWLAGPQVEADEGSYLLTAARLAGRLHDVGALGYYSGYSLLLVPAFLVTHDATSSYHAALVINAALVATIPFALYRLTRLLFADIDAQRHVAAAVIATCYSSLLIISQYTMSENALAPFYAWSMTAGAMTIFRGRARDAICAGCLAGMLFLIHPRGGAIAVPLLAVLSLAAISRRGLRKSAVLAWIAVIATASLHAPIELLAGKRTGVVGSYSIGDSLSRLASDHAWKWVSVNLLGSVTEAVVTTLGVLLLAGIAIAESLARTRMSWRSPRAPVLVALALGLCTAFLLSALFFIPPTRADQIAYGRYALPAVIPMISIGVLHFPSTNRGYLRLAIGSIAVAGTCLILLAFAFNRIPHSITSTWNFINSPTLFLASRLHADNAFAGMAFFFIVGVGLICGFGWIAGSNAARAAFLAVNTSLAIYASSAITVPLSRYYAHARRIVDTAQEFERVTGASICAAISPQIDLWASIDYKWRLFPQANAQARDDRLCVRGYVMPIAESIRRKPGTRLVEVDPRSPLGRWQSGLFITEGAPLDTWVKAHPLLSIDNYAPAPANERRALIAVNLPPERTTVGSTITLVVSVTNKSSSSIWGPVRESPFPIVLGARTDYRGPSSVRVSSEYRAELPTDLSPGRTAETNLLIGPFGQPGMYRITVGILQEGVAWYEGMQTLAIDVVGK